ncbi:hypothetical protein Lal_00015309 [Lupinus albus]|nr:hypothetical protein Lal_00015309 [Lupinus albus]
MRVGSQPTIKSIFKKNLREETCQEIATFFYNNVIAFNVTNSDEFKKMFELVVRHDIGFKPPSYHEIRVKYLKQQVVSTKLATEEHKAFWKKVGCTIMTDGWTNKRRRTIMNFLVNSPKGTNFFKSIDASHFSKTTDKVFRMMDEIVEEVGEENVVQIVTDNATNYKAVRELLMRKRMKLYWTPCAAHCIDLMLEDFEKKIPIHKETIEHGLLLYPYCIIILRGQIQPHTRFATSYLTLGCLVDNKQVLIRMFTSTEWTSSQCAKTKDGRFVENVVIDRVLEQHCGLLEGCLSKVFRLVDSNEKPVMGFIYEAMDHAKEKIQIVFNNVKKSYFPIWEIIDQRWDNQLHRHLHVVHYYLNPKLHYDPNFKADVEVKRGCMIVLQRWWEYERNR